MRMTSRRDGRWLVPLLLSVLVIAPRALGQAEAEKPAKWTVLEDLWYAIEIGGTKAGWMNNVAESDGERYRTTNTTHIAVARGDTPITVDIISSFIETHAGEPVRLESTTKAAKQDTRGVYEFTPEHVLHTSSQGGREMKKTLPLPDGDWLTPMEVERFVKEKIAGGAEEFTYRTIDGQNGMKAVNFTSRRDGEGTFELEGVSQQVSIWKSKSDVMPVEGVEHFTSDGRLVHQETNIGIGQMVLRLSTKAQAKAEGKGGAPELLFNTFITPSKPIDNPMKAVRAKYKLKVKNGEMPAIAAAGSQRVDPGEDGATAMLTIDFRDPLPAAADELTNPEYLEASTLVDSTDELVIKLSQRATRNAGDDAAKKAEALRELVHRHVTRKGLETAFASASETARTKQGDCSEHGVLLCALLRAAGIPARVATGLVYVDHFMGENGVFGWHIWTQALIDGKWVDLDATLPANTPYHAGHVLTSTTSLANGSGDASMASMIQLMGNLDIEVISVEYE